MVLKTAKNPVTDIKMRFDLLEAQYPSLERSEQIVLIACLSGIDPNTLTAETPVDLIASEFKDLASKGSTNRYRDLKASVKRLYNRSITIDNPDPNNPKLTQTQTRWVHAIDYYPDEGRIRLYFAPKLIPYLAKLDSKYRSYEKLKASNFSSKHTFKLYQMLIKWQGKGHVEKTLDDIRIIFALGKNYDRIDKLKKRVIDPAIADINEHTNLWVGTRSERREKRFYSQRKNGRRVVAFQFSFGFKGDEGDPMIKKQPKKLSVQQFSDANPHLTYGKNADEVIEIMKNEEKDDNQREMF
jgi:plasmid replication initiation protein